MIIFRTGFCQSRLCRPKSLKSSHHPARLAQSFTSIADDTESTKMVIRLRFILLN